MDRVDQLAAVRDCRLRDINRMIAATADFGPLHKPLYNSFLKPYNRGSKKQWGNDNWANATTIAQRIEEDNLAQGERRLSRFADTHLVYRTESGQASHRASGGPEAWAEASVEDILNLLLDLFDEFPLTISKQTFYQANKSVEFEGIWAGPTGLRTKYRRLCRTEFVHLAKSTYICCFRTHDRKKLEKAYDRHMKADGIKSLQIGLVEGMPSWPTLASTQVAA
ncbi:hypothetical protein LTR95_013107 [Oleoguttula sp. CCFEE 5521]